MEVFSYVCDSNRTQSMKKLLTFLSLTVVTVASFGQSQIDRVLNKTQNMMNDLMNEVRQQQNQVMAAYEEERSKVQERYEAFCAECMAKWGDKTMVESTRKEWVDYSPDNERRSIVDFESGDVKVEVLVDPDEDDRTVNEKLEMAVEELLNNKGTVPSYDRDVTSVENISVRPILEDQIDLSGLNPEDEDVAGKIVEDKVKDERVVDTDKGDKRVVSIHLKLVEDHIPKRAEKFRELIASHSRRYGIDEPLIYAIMEQESAFNPMARSSAGAYGLMQIVPRYGGRDANGYVNNRDVEPKPYELYDPDFNIQLGVGYLKKQMEVYFEGVTDRKNLMLCAIAAYNTGQGNVYYALTGSRSPKGASQRVNALTYDRLYRHLKVYLPCAETRDYIQKVTSKMQKYIK